jgi:hypothetical protein
MIKKTRKRKKRVTTIVKMVRKKNKLSSTRKDSYGKSKISSLYQHGIEGT